MTHDNSGRLRVLFVCSMNQWRSPTAETIWRRSSDVDVRSRGLSPKARRRLIQDDLAWAELIFLMTHEQRDRLVEQHRRHVRSRDMIVLEIPDEFGFMDPELIDLLESRAGPEIARVLASKGD